MIGAMEDMHPQMQRLYAAAKELRGIEGQTPVARALNASPQTVKNWETRGISDGGLLDAQKYIGCDAVWLRDGSGSMRGNGGESIGLADAIRLLDLFDKSTDVGKAQILRMAESAQKKPAP